MHIQKKKKNMARALWKGKYINMDYTNHIFSNIKSLTKLIVTKNNQYIFSEFKNLKFIVYNGERWRTFFIIINNVGFVSGVFIMTREMHVIHNLKKVRNNELKNNKL